MRDDFANVRFSVLATQHKSRGWKQTPMNHDLGLSLIRNKRFQDRVRKTDPRAMSEIIKDIFGSILHEMKGDELGQRIFSTSKPKRFALEMSSMVRTARKTNAAKRPDARIEKFILVHCDLNVLISLSPDAVSHFHCLPLLKFSPNWTTIVIKQFRGHGFVHFQSNLLAV
jgi:hypothetical protein